MKYYCFVYPFCEERRSSTIAQFESDELAIERAVWMLEQTIATDCLDVYGDRIIVIRTTASKDRVYTEAIADVLINECEDCDEPYVEVFEA